MTETQPQVYFKVSLEDGHLGQATPHDILYVHCKLIHLTLWNVICREINFDFDFFFDFDSLFLSS